MRSKALAITAGNPDGIGPEIVLKTLSAIFSSRAKPFWGSPQDFRSLQELQRKILSPSYMGKGREFLILGSLDVFRWYAKKYRILFSVVPEDDMELKKILPRISIYRIESIENSIAFPVRVLFLDIPLLWGSCFKSSDEFMRYAISFSRSGDEPCHKQMEASRLSGENAYRVLWASARLIKHGRVGGVVNAPVNKASISAHSPLKNFSGQTEFYARIFQNKKFSMTFFSPLFYLVLLTSHIPLSQVSSRITPQVVARGIDHAFEIRRMIRDKKKILFLGMNPHAGEGGRIGGEDEKIRSLIKKHRYGKYVEGPISADTAFIKVFAGHYRMVIACYHDQGLIPLKSTGDNIRHSVDVTWGLPFVRTTVDHGTAFDIVGKNLAQPFSLISAFSLAISLLENKFHVL